jgi:hypothetical protein
MRLRVEEMYVATRWRRRRSGWEFFWGVVGLLAVAAGGVLGGWGGAAGCFLAACILYAICSKD